MKLLQTLTAVLLLFFSSTLFAQTQLGNTMYGQNSFSYFGRTVSMPDATTIAVGAPASSGGGLVSVYTLINNVWVQKGLDISDGGTYDFGESVSMPDANTVAMSCQFTGNVHVYHWLANSWQQKGIEIGGGVGGTAGGGSGRENTSVSMPDANTLAIGNPTAAAGGNTRVYTWVGNSWMQKGATIQGEAGGDLSGCSVSMPDANTIAIGAVHNDGGANNGGHTRVYEWSGTSWLQKGLDIDGLLALEKSGMAVSMPDANTLAVGAPEGLAPSGGRTRIFEWVANAWSQKGSDLIGTQTGMEFGGAVSMPNANTIAIGAKEGEDATISPTVKGGKILIYEWLNNSWIQKGIEINGPKGNDQFGIAVSMPDANTFAGGAHYGHDNPIPATLGYAKVFGFAVPLHLPSISLEKNILEIYPNPVTDVVRIDIDAEELRVLNPLGERVLSSVNSEINISSLAAGLYFIQATKDGQVYTGQILKK